MRVTRDGRLGAARGPATSRADSQPTTNARAKAGASLWNVIRASYVGSNGFFPAQPGCAAVDDQLGKSRALVTRNARQPRPIAHALQGRDARYNASESPITIECCL